MRTIPGQLTEVEQIAKDSLALRDVPEGTVVGKLIKVLRDAYAVAPGGEVRPLKVGDVIKLGDVVWAPEGANAVFELSDGIRFELTTDDRVLLDNNVLAGIRDTAKDSAVLTQTIDKVIEEGELELEPTAAGAGATEGGASFTILTNATSAIDAQSFSFDAARTTDNSGLGDNNFGVGTPTIVSVVPFTSPTPTNPTGVSLALQGNAIKEGDTVVFQVALSRASDTPFEVPFSLPAGGSTANSADLGDVTFSNGVTLTSQGTLLIPANVTGFSITVPTVDDSVYEGNESLNVTLGGVTGTATITDEADKPTAGPVTVVDGNGVAVVGGEVPEGQDLFFSVTLTGTSAVPFELPFGLPAAGSVASTTDIGTLTFTNGVTLGNNGNLIIPAGVSQFTIQVPTLADNLTEGRESLIAQVGAAVGTGTIVDPGPVKTITVVDKNGADLVGGKVPEGQDVTFKVTLNSPPTQDLTVGYVLPGNGSKASSTDLGNAVFSNGVTINAQGQLVIPAGVASFTVTVPTVDDQMYEGDEPLVLQIDTASGTAVITDEADKPTAGPITVVDGNGVAIVGGNVAEGETIRYDVKLTGQSAVAFELPFTLPGANSVAGTADIGTATFTNGVTLTANGTLLVPAGTTSFQVLVPSVVDQLNEGSEALTLTVGTATGTANIVDTVGVNKITIVDGNGNTITDGKVEEGQTINYLVTLTQTTAVPTELDYVFPASGSVALVGQPGTDADAYVPEFTNGVSLVNGKLVVPVGVDSFIIKVGTENDTRDEPDEALLLKVGTQTGTAIIVDNDIEVETIDPKKPDPNNPGQFISADRVVEGNDVTFTVTLKQTTNVAGTLSLALPGTNTGAGNVSADDLNISATKPMVVTFDNGSTVQLTTANITELSIPPGVKTFQITIPTLDDTMDEADEESFQIQVGGVTGQAYLLDNDGPTVTIGDPNGPANNTNAVSVTEDNGAGAPNTAILAVNFSGLAAGSSMTLALGSAVPDGATMGADISTTLRYSTDNGVTWNGYTGAVAMGNVTAGTWLVEVTTVADTLDEKDERANLQVKIDTGTTSVMANGTVIIVDNDIEIDTVTPGYPAGNGLFVSTASVNEGDDAFFTVKLKQPTNGTAEVPVELLLTTTGEAGKASAADVGTVTLYSVDGSTTLGTATFANGTVTLPAGVQQFTLKVPTVNDTLTEITETLSLRAGGSTGVTGSASILDNDSPTFVFKDGNATVTTATVIEGDYNPSDDLSKWNAKELTIDVSNAAAGSTLALSLTNGTATTVDYREYIQYKNSQGTWVDYSGPLTLSEATSQKVEVRVHAIGDGVDEPNETFTVTATLSSAGKTVTQNATITILDDDEKPYANSTQFTANVNEAVKLSGGLATAEESSASNNVSEQDAVFRDADGQKVDWLFAVTDGAKVQIAGVDVKSDGQSLTWAVGNNTSATWDGNTYTKTLTAYYTVGNQQVTVFTVGLRENDFKVENAEGVTSYKYSVKLEKPLDHGVQGEDVLALSLPMTITDGFNPQPHVLNVNFKDDMPVVANITLGSAQVTDQSLFGAAGTGFGADGPGYVSEVLITSGSDAGYRYAFDGTQITLHEPNKQPQSVQGYTVTKGGLTIDFDKATYTYSLAANSTPNVRFTVIDGDGDTSTASITSGDYVSVKAVSASVSEDGNPDPANSAAVYAEFTVKTSATAVSLSIDGLGTAGNVSVEDLESFTKTGVTNVIQYWDGNSWQPYNGTSVAVANGDLRVRIEIADDNLTEGSEKLTLKAQASVNSTTITSMDTVTVLDDKGKDNPNVDQEARADGLSVLPVAFADNTYTTVSSGATVSVQEGSATSTQYAHYSVKLSGAAAENVNVTLALSSATATADVDYRASGMQYSTDNGQTWTAVTNAGAANATLTLPASGGAVLVRVPVLGDALVENAEVLKLTATAPAGALKVSATANADVTIQDDDSQSPPVIATNGNAVVFEAGLPNGLPSGSQPETFTGNMGITDPNGDPLTVTLSAPTGVNLKSAGQALSWSGTGTAADPLLAKTPAGTEIIRVTVNAQGAYTVTLSGPLDHAGGLSDTNVLDSLNFNIGVTASDATASTTGTIQVQVRDDDPAVPQALKAETVSVNTTTQGNIFANGQGVMTGGFGADGGYVKTITIGGNTYTFNGTSISSQGADPMVVSHTANGKDLTLTTVKGETLTIDMATGQYTYRTTGQVAGAQSQVGPQVGAANNSLLGLINANVLDVLKIGGDNKLYAYDANNDLKSVVLKSSALIGTGTLRYSTGLANELGILVTSESCSITLTSQNAKLPLDNLSVQQLLQTVYVEYRSILGIVQIPQVLPKFTIEATDMGGDTATANNVDLLGLNLLGSNSAAYVQGTSGADTYNGSSSANFYIGGAGNDIINGNAGNDLLRGGAGNDTLNGGDGNDFIVGGAGNDTLTGGAGSDVFRFERGNTGNDTITDFNLSTGAAAGGDIIDLTDLLQGEAVVYKNGQAVSINLTSYLHVEINAVESTLYVSANGAFYNGFDASKADQQIRLTGVDLSDLGLTDRAILEALINRGQLLVDQAQAGESYKNTDATDVQFGVVDNDGDSVSTTVRFDPAGGSTTTASANAPQVGVANNALLGLVSANVADLIKLGDGQAFTAFDKDNNLTRVDLTHSALVSTSTVTWNYSQALADELGLVIKADNVTGLAGLLGGSQSISITSANSTVVNGVTVPGLISNAAINEFLGSVYFSGGQIDATVLPNTTITAYDSTGLSTTANAGSLAGANLLSAKNPLIIEGTSGNDGTLSGDANDNRMYGYGGDDTMSGGAGNDLLRGGAGDDTMNGGEGNDILIGGLGNDTLTGGLGDDVFKWELNDEGTTAAPAIDVIKDFGIDSDVIDLRDLLNGESQTSGNLLNYLHFEQDGTTAVVKISTDGLFANGTYDAKVDQEIRLENFNLAGADDAAKLQSLLSANKLIVD